MSRISPFSSLDPLRYCTASALVIALRVAIDSSIHQDHPDSRRDRRSDPPPAGPFSVRQRNRYADLLDESTRALAKAAERVLATLRTAAATRPATAPTLPGSRAGQTTAVIPPSMCTIWPFT